MLSDLGEYNINPRSLSKLICNGAFKVFIGEGTDKSYVKNLSKLLLKSGVYISKENSVKEILDFSYKYLSEQYKHEYIYKSSLLNDFIFKHFSLDDTVLLNEFKIAKSKADVVVVNGTNKVFEIKTELDTPDRLKTQLNDYFKAFSEVYIVTHHRLADKYEKLLSPHIGIISMGDDTSLKIFKVASLFSDNLNTEAMMRSLRKNEYLYLVKNITGSIPYTSDTMLFKACLKQLEALDPLEVQKFYLRALKTRIIQEQPYLLSDDIPKYFKYTCYNLNLNENQYIRLIKKLSNKVTNY